MIRYKKGIKLKVLSLFTYVRFKVDLHQISFYDINDRTYNVLNPD
jgi:hypothetical protein